ncbi:hypothetical protein FLL45_09900 [Aliikangiella marina]|uniref:STAS/SEC14 domain-containing protein n=1 Tax=Aliikangiella marina TaxID=1712262 RepID=A0A545TDE6_9GAMM|nr:hypothetical protein [Aliikangiella marina]TQV75239.1 hypothetical protein FLL45_09900 [Aliikangiella marina]
MAFKIHQHRKYFLLKYSGRVDKDLIIQSYSGLFNEPNFNSESHTIWDFTQSVLDMSLEDIRNVAEAVVSVSNKRSNSARSAFIVTDPSDKAIIETYITETSRFPVEFEIFEDIREGESWLIES